MSLPPDIIYTTLGYTINPSQYSSVSKVFREYARIVKEETLRYANQVYHFWNENIFVMMYQMNRAALEGDWHVIMVMLENTTDAIHEYVCGLLHEFHLDSLLPQVIRLSGRGIDDMNSPELLYAAWVTYGNDHKYRDALDRQTRKMIRDNTLPDISWMGYIHPGMIPIINEMIIYPDDSDADVFRPSIIPPEDRSDISMARISNPDMTFVEYLQGSPAMDPRDIIMEIEKLDTALTPGIINKYKSLLTMTNSTLAISDLLEDSNIANPVLIERSYQFWDTHDMETLQDIVYDTEVDPAERLAIAYAINIPLTKDIIN
jgi:hypothetical protein